MPWTKSVCLGRNQAGGPGPIYRAAGQFTAEFRWHTLLGVEAFRGACAGCGYLRSDFSLAWVSDNLPFVGDVGERWLKGLRVAGVPG